MRLITNTELVFVSGGNVVTEDGIIDAAAGRHGIGIGDIDDMQMNPVIIVALIGAAGAVIGAALAYFKEPATPPVLTKTTVSTYTCGQTSDGSTVCTVTGKHETAHEYQKK